MVRDTKIFRATLSRFTKRVESVILWEEREFLARPFYRSWKSSAFTFSVFLACLLPDLLDGHEAKLLIVVSRLGQMWLEILVQLRTQDTCSSEENPRSKEGLYCRATMTSGGSARHEERSTLARATITSIGTRVTLGKSIPTLAATIASFWTFPFFQYNDVRSIVNASRCESSFLSQPHR
jgi:hypothetical protein